MSIIVAGPASCDEVTATPFVDIQGEYTDNLLNNTENPIDDFITNIKPGFDFSKVDGRWNIFLSAEAAVKIYSENSEFDNVDQAYLSSFKRQMTERLNMSLNAGFVVDSRSDWDFDEAGLIDGDRILKKVVRKDLDLGTSMSFDLSEITSTDLAYDFTDNTFDDPDYLDYYSHAISFRVNRQLSGPFPRMIIYAQTGYYWYQSIDKPIEHPVFDENYEKENELNSISFLAGTEGYLSETLSLTFEYGGRYVKTTAVSTVSGEVTGESEDEGWEHLGEISLDSYGEKGRWDFTVRHDIRPRTGSGVFVNNTAVSFKYGHLLTESLRAGIRTGYYLNRSHGSLDLDEIDVETIRVVPDVVYLLTKTLSLECQYDYSRIHDREDDTDTERNRVMVTVSYRYPVEL